MKGGSRSVARCGRGHLFTISYRWQWYGGLFTMIRLGFGAYMRCPVGNHWALCRPVNKNDLTQQERQNLRLRERIDDQAGIRLNSSIGLLIGVSTLAITIVVQSWLWALASALWILVWGAVLIWASRKSNPLDAPQ